MKGHNFGVCEKCGKVHLGTTGKKRSNKFKKELSDRMIELWKDPEFRKERLKTFISWPKNKPRDDRTRDKISIGLSKTMKKLWKNPEFRENVVKAILKAMRKRPTLLEQQYYALFKKYDLPYKYTGDGDVIIGGKNPDFVNVNGQKKCIEVTSNSFRKFINDESFKHYEQRRISHFAKYGWECLVFSEEDLKDEKRILEVLKW